MTDSSSRITSCYAASTGEDLIWSREAANPDNKQLADWLDAQLATFDKIYAGDSRPLYLDGYKKLKEAITPWGA
jgi:hypothetical protein